MSNNVAIKVENLSKAYQIGEFSTGTISQDIERWWLTKVRGKEDPFLKIGELNDRSIRGASNIVWSLKDINFEIKQGDAVGIIGKNGAGKSTLLKLLSRVTAPTTGSFKVKGRIASLLEVGTGFHPELTGRENIFLNGAILGMRKHEIKRKLDEIIDFSGVERYVDTPVKRYSSGMYVRLAFAVAAHLESEILIVDEVLAVGDADFQKKCLGKMGDVSRGEGRTILFVSHNLQSIKNLCEKSILLANGAINCFDNTDRVLNLYNKLDNNLKFYQNLTMENSYLKLIEISICNQFFEVLKHLNTDIDIDVIIRIKPILINYYLGITLIIKDDLDNIVFSTISLFGKTNYIHVLSDNIVSFVCKIPKKLFNDKLYKIDLISFKSDFSDSTYFNDLLCFEVEDGSSARGFFKGKIEGSIRPELNWTLKND